MKRILFLAALVGIAAVSHATVTINFSIGILSDNTGTPVADGSLIQIIGSADNSFAAPTAGSFIGGNDTILFSGSFDSSFFGDPGAMGLPLVGTYAAGTNLLVRWFPTLTTASATPGGSTIFGEYGSLTDATWVVPADGSTVGINFLTTFEGGPNPDTAGRAILSTAPIPEPSTYAAIFGVMALGVVALRRRNAQAA